MANTSFGSGINRASLPSTTSNNPGQPPVTKKPTTVRRTSRHVHREPATPAGGEVKTVCNTTNICQHYELVCEVNVYVTEITPEVPRVPQVPRIDLGGYPYNVPAAASGMGLEPMEIVEPGDPAVMQARVPVIIQPGGDEAAGLGWIFAFRPGRAFKELREQQEERHELQYEMGPLDGGPAKHRTARCNNSACMGPAPASTASSATPSNAPANTFGPGMWRSLEVSFAVSPLAAPSPIELPAGVVPTLSNRYSLGLSLDLVERRHQSTYEKIHEKRGVAERVEPKDPNGRGTVYTAMQYRVFPGAGQAAVAECHVEHEDQWILRRLEYIVSDPNVDMDPGVRAHLTTALSKRGTLARDDVWALIFAGHADDEVFRRELKRVVDSAMPTRQEIYDLAAECDARSSRFLLAVNSTLHLQNINADLSVPHWRANLVATRRFGRRDTLINRRPSTSMGPAPGWRATATLQGGVNALPEQADGDRWLGGLDGRLTLRFYRWLLTRAEGGVRWPGNIGFWSAGAVADFILPLGFTLSPGYRVTGYPNQEPDHRVFLNVGWGRYNPNDLNWPGPWVKTQR